jgi:hypothetical protein
MTDMAKIIEYMKAYHPDSNMSDIPFDRPSVSKVVEYFILNKDYQPLIAVDEEGELRGLLFGSLEPYFFNRKRCYGTDLLFISKGAGPQLWRNFKDWAFNSGADRILVGVSSGDPRSDQLLEALGMTSTGGMYELRR